MIDRASAESGHTLVPGRSYVKQGNSYALVLLRTVMRYTGDPIGWNKTGDCLRG
jgi:hypothetical protein